jgi:hypothetical protein
MLADSERCGLFWLCFLIQHLCHLYYMLAYDFYFQFIVVSMMPDIHLFEVANFGELLAKC